MGTTIEAARYLVRRVREAPVVFGEEERIYFSRFQLDLEPGVGLTTGQGADPQVCLQYSDDYGQSWSKERWRSAGKIGETKHRVIWRQLGQGRHRLFRISVADPVSWTIVNALIDVERGEH